MANIVLEMLDGFPSIWILMNRVYKVHVFTNDYEWLDQMNVSSRHSNYESIYHIVIPWPLFLTDWKFTFIFVPMENHSGTIHDKLIIISKLVRQYTSKGWV